MSEGALEPTAQHSSPVAHYVKIAGTVIASVGFATLMLGANAWQIGLLRDQVRQLTRIADALEHRNTDTDGGTP